MCQIGGPIVSVDKVSHDFGSSDWTRSISHVFEISNAGDEPLEIVDVKKGCGCTSVLLDGRSVEPNATGKVKVGYRPIPGEYRSGENTFTVELITNDPARPVVTLSVTGELLAPLIVSPATIEFGDVPFGGTESKLLVVKSTESRDLSAVSAISRFPDIALSNPAENGREKTDEVRLRVDFSARSRIGEIGETIFIRTGVEGVPLIPVKVSARVVSLWTIKPDFIDAGTMPFGSKHEAEFHIWRPRDYTGQVSVLSQSGTRLSIARLENVDMKEYERFELEFVATRPQGIVNELVVFTNDAGELIGAAEFRALVTSGQRK